MEETTELYGALARHDEDAAIGILRNNPAIRDSFIVVGKTALHLAAQKNQCAVLRFLLDSGVDVDLLTEDGTSSALDIAAGQGHVEASMTLLEYEADVNRGFGTKATPIFSAIYGQSIAVVMAMIEYGANLQASFGDGIDVISYARQHGTQEIVEHLASSSMGPQNG